MSDALHLKLLALSALPEEQIDLAEFALLLAQDAYPELQIQDYLARLDDMADHIQSRLTEGGDFHDRLSALNAYLFQEQGFRGNFDDYYDTRNSYLNEVLDRRTGIPISLSVIYMELGQRIGLPLEGVSFPGHFLVQCPVADGQIVVDPFSGGVSLDEEDLQHRLISVVGERRAARLDMAQLLEPAAKQDILVRMMANLKVLLIKEERFADAILLLNRLIALNPQRIEEVRDRGKLYIASECFRSALDDLNRYLRQRPDASDGEEVRELVVDLQSKAHSLN